MSSTLEYIKRALAGRIAATLQRSNATLSDAKQPSLEVSVSAPASTTSNDDGNSLTTKRKRKSRWGQVSPSSVVAVSSSSEASSSPSSGNEGHESEHKKSQSSSWNDFDYLQKCEYMLNEESENDSISLCNPLNTESPSSSSMSLSQFIYDNPGDFSRMLNCKRVCRCSSDDEELLSFGDEALQVTNSFDFELDEFGRARRDLSFLIDHSKVSSRLEFVMMKKKELRKENRQVVPPHVLRDRLMDEFEREQAESERREAITLAARKFHAAKIYQEEVSKKSKPYIESSQVILDYFNDNGFNEKEARSLALEVIFNHHWEQRYPVRRIHPPCPNGACV